MFRYFLTISTSTIIALGYSLSLLAQESPVAEPSTTPTPGAEVTPMPDKTQESPVAEPDTMPTPAADATSLPENIGQNANPLFFPTNPEQVETSNIQFLTLEQAIELARRNNQELEVAILDLKRSRQELREALAGRNPTLATQVDFSRDDGASSELSIARDALRGEDTSNATTITRTFEARLELNYDIYTGGRRSANIRLRRKQVRSNQLEVERIAEETRFNVTSDYYGLQDADANVRIEEAAVEEATKSLEDAELLEKAGLGTKFDVLRAQVDLSNAQQRLTTARSDRRTARRQLARRIGLAQNVEVMAADPIEVGGDWNLSLEETIILAYKNRAELEQFLLQREIAKEQELISIADIRPRVNVFANYNVLGVFDDDLNPADGLALGARMRWNLFDGGVAQARRDRDKVDGELAESRFSNQRDEIRLQVESAFFDLEANKENIETAEKAAELAEESLRLARLRFQAGVGTQLDVIDAQTELTRARGNLLDAVIAYNTDLANLQRAVSNLPDNRLFDLP